MLLSEPIETVEDLELEKRAKRRKEIEIEMQRERMRDVTESPSNKGKGKGRMLVYDSDDDDLDVAFPKKAKAPAFSLATPTKSPRLSSDRPVTPPPRPSTKLPLSPSPSLGLPFAFQTSSPRTSTATPLPAPLASLLSLHSALERALIIHLSTAGSTIASSISDVDSASNEAKVKMANLIDLPTLTRMLESSGKRFGENELRRLVWVWQGAGGLSRGDTADELGGSPRGRNTVVLGRDGEDEVGGMGFVVSRARVASTSSSAGPRVSQTYGLGISVSLRTNPQLPKLELVSPSSGKRRSIAAPPSPSSVGKGRDGMSIVALWTQGKEQRRKEVERRLRRWAERQVKAEEVRHLVVFSSLNRLSSHRTAPLDGRGRARLDSFRLNRQQRPTRRPSLAHARRPRHPVHDYAKPKEGFYLGDAHARPGEASGRLARQLCRYAAQRQAGQGQGRECR